MTMPENLELACTAEAEAAQNTMTTEILKANFNNDAGKATSFSNIRYIRPPVAAPCKMWPGEPAIGSRS